MSAANGAATRTVEETKNWPDLALGLYERLTGMGSEISYEFHDMVVEVPSKTGKDAEHATWKLNGTLKVRTANTGQ
jgi:hypothetical protein